MAHNGIRRLLLVNGKIYTDSRFIERGSMLVGADGKIEAVGESAIEAADAEVLDLSGKTVFPGFVDVHVHGGGGYQAMDGSFEGLNGMSLYHAAHGTTSFLATTEADTEARITRALRNAAEAYEPGLDGAELLGVHLEGPFLNTSRAGAQDASNIRSVDPDELQRYIQASRNLIRLVTLAPEIEGGMDAVARLTQAGIAVSVGHSDATYDQMLEAVKRGATHTTHHFNGMSPLHHREPGVAGAGLIRPELTTELIADGIHVHPAVVKLLFDVKGARRVCVITDSVYSAGLPDGDYGNATMKNGQIWLKDGSSLAGSSLTMLQALKNVVAFTGYAAEELLPSFTEVPARQIGVSERKGKLEARMDADFLVVDDELRLYSTYVRGKQVYAG